MLCSLINRRRYLDFLAEGGSGADFAIEFVNDVATLTAMLRSSRGGEQQLALLWGDNESLLSGQAPLLVVNDEDYRDLLAWASTYVGTYTPFTAFFRVIMVSDFYRYDLFEKYESSLERSLLLRLAGVVIAEAAAQTGYRSTRPDQISLQSCQLTFSMAVLRAISLGYHPSLLFDLAEAWTSARRITASRPVALDAERIASFWILCVSALSERPNLGEAGSWMSVVSQLLRSARDGRERVWSSVEWNEFGAVGTALREFEQALEQPRDKRLRKLDEVIDRLLSHSFPEPLVEAIFGYCLARLSSGSFDYLGLAADYKEKMPSCGLWFSIFSVWEKNFDGLSSGNSLGRHVSQGLPLSRDLFVLPTGNVSIAELELLSQRKSAGPLRNIYGSAVDVEIAPLVSARFPNPVRRTDDDAVGQRPETPNVSRISKMLREAIFLLEQADRPVEHMQPSLDGLFRNNASTSTTKSKRPTRPRKN